MNDQMRIGMREATRLTRAGRLLEATAIIQRTLRGLAPDLGGDATSQPTDEAIEGTFRVIDPTPRPTEDAAREPDLRSNTASVVALPPHTAEAPPRRRDSSAELTNPPPPPSAPPPAAIWPWGVNEPRRHRRRPGRRRGRTAHRTPRVPAGSFSPDRIPMRPAPAPTNCTSPVAIGGKRCPWSSCCTAVRRPLTISPPSPA